tara:strand:+ start:383 stop:526 length:144 start_codon:yes stop_codon:yes gene_type:complete
MFPYDNRILLRLGDFFTFIHKEKEAKNKFLSLLLKVFERVLRYISKI